MNNSNEMMVRHYYGKNGRGFGEKEAHRSEQMIKNFHSEINYAADHVYYNIIIPNKDNFNNIPAQFTDFRSEPIISHPSEFEMSIIRFSVPGIAIPIFIYPNNLPTSFTPNDTIYSVTLTYSADGFKTDFHDSQKFTQFVSNIPNSKTDRYFYITSYHQMLDMLNTAFAAAYDDLKNTQKVPLTPTAAPYFTYDSETGLISLFAEQAYVSATSNTRVYISYRVLNLMNSFNGKFISDDNGAIINGKYFQFTIEDTKNNIPVSPVGYYQMTQDFSTLFLWNILKSIVITTGTIPTRYEIVPISSGSQTSAQNNFLPIVSDFEPLIQSGTDAFSTIQYFPPGEYRMIDLKGNNPLITVNVNFQWQDTSLNLHQLYIPPGMSATIKFLFRKRR